MQKKIYNRILVTAQQLEEAVSRLAKQLNACYIDGEEVLALVVLEGAKYFAQDLLAKIKFPLEVEYLKASSYHGRTRSTGHVELHEAQDLKQKIAGKKILLIDDIYDTGLTLSKVLDWLDGCKPREVKTCVLLEKEIPHQKEISIDFLGLTIEDAFVIGYGLDYEGQYRELPFVAVLSL